MSSFMVIVHNKKGAAPCLARLLAQYSPAAAEALAGVINECGFMGDPIPVALNISVEVKK